MEEDILNNSQTVMFRGKLCMEYSGGGVIIQENNIYPCAFMLEEIEVLFVPPTYIQLVMCKHLIGIQKFFFFLIGNSSI